MEVGAYEAKTHLAALLERVARGERITITKHGRPVAMLVPPPGARTVPVEDAIAAMRAFSRRRKLDGLSLKTMIEEGRR